MSDINDFKKHDIKAEVILAEIIEKSQGMVLDDIAIQPDGGFNHNNRRSLESIVENPISNQSTKHIANVARKGLYDLIPEGVTHVKRVNKGSQLTRKEILIGDIIRKKEEEKAARKYFAPFDQTLNRYRLLIELEERKMIVGFPTGTKHAFYDILWDENHHFLSDYQKSTLFTILPLAHEISSDIYLIALAYKSVLTYDVQGEVLWRKQQFTDTSTHSLNNEFNLGNDFVLGDTITVDTQVYHITIGPISIGDSLRFLPNHQDQLTLLLLQSYLIPFDVEVQYFYAFEGKDLQLDNATLGPENRLGYTINL